MRARLLGCLLFVAAAVAAGAAMRPAPREAAGKVRGICWEGAGRIEAQHLRPLRDLGADWISQTPFGWSRSLDDPHVTLATGGRILWGESDSGLVQTATWARELGLRTLLKPHLWVHHGAWPGDIAMQSEADWQTWFRDYEAFILHYAELAARHGMEGLAVGTELSKTTHRTADWRQLIARVREVYDGSLTYCANWHDEVERLEFWDALDVIGVQAYYPLADSTRPAPAEIRAAWAPIAVRLEGLAARTGKRIVFTEVGYRSVAGALRQPWSWDTRGEPDALLQRDAFAALYTTFWERPWFGGTYVWKWHPVPERRRPERALRDFTPQDKPALDIIRSVYRGGTAALRRRGGASE